MTNKWPNTQLGIVCEVIAGQSPEGHHYNDVGEGLPFYQGKKEFGFKFLGEPKVWTRQTTKSANTGDIVMSVRAPVGPVNIVSEKSCIGRGLAALQVKPMLDRDFLYYFLDMSQDKLMSNEGTVFPSINKAQIEAIDLPLPPLDEQKRIVAKLDEALADLDQVTENSKTSLQQINALWTAFLVESFNPRENSIGADLESWQEREFSDVIDVYQPVTISTKQLVPDGPYLVYGANGVIGRYSDFNHEESELLMTCRGATCGALTISESKSWINGNAMVVRPKQADLHKEFIYYALLGGVDIDSAITGTAQPQITRTSLAKILIKYPPLSKQKNIVAKLDDLKQQIKAMQKAKQGKIEQASSLRSSILSAAFAGDF